MIFFSPIGPDSAWCRQESSAEGFAILHLSRPVAGAESLCCTNTLMSPSWVKSTPGLQQGTVQEPHTQCKQGRGTSVMHQQSFIGAQAPKHPGLTTLLKPGIFCRCLAPESMTENAVQQELLKPNPWLSALEHLHSKTVNVSIFKSLCLTDALHKQTVIVPILWWKPAINAELLSKTIWQHVLPHQSEGAYTWISMSGQLSVTSFGFNLTCCFSCAVGCLRPAAKHRCTRQNICTSKQIKAISKTTGPWLPGRAAKRNLINSSGWNGKGEEMDLC